MPIDPNAATGEWGDWNERSWTSKDALLYALGVGAGASDPTGAELEFTTENSRGVDQKVLPTFGVLVASAGGGPGAPGPSIRRCSSTPGAVSNCCARSRSRAGYGAAAG